MAAVAPLVATDVTGATASFLLSRRRAGRLVLPRCSFALSPAQRYPPRPDLPHPVLSRPQQQPRAAAYGRALLRAAVYDRAHLCTAVCANNSACRQHLAVGGGRCGGGGCALPAARPTPPFSGIRREGGGEVAGGG
ncbi:unnamed protein product [Closterium sp. NIES-54]